ncbi:MAG: hypothetical protein K6G25_06180 [Bacteroidales bacterium]|nr:hypothetical protein [Bacteroidales bacterium]
MSEYSQIIQEAIRIGVTEATRILTPKSDELSQREAYAEFGKAFVDKMVADGKVGYVRKGMDKKCKKTYSRAELTKAMAERKVLRCIIRLETARP